MLLTRGLATRSHQPELMDAPDIPAEELWRTLDELALINRWLGGYRPSIAGLRKLLPAGCSRFRLLDVGCGGGDVAKRVHAWATRNRLDARILGIDLQPAAVAYARRQSADLGGLEFSEQDLFELPDEPTFDVVHAALVLHHFDAASLPRALRKMFGLARWGVVVNDLHRHPIAYHSIALLTRLLSRSRLIRNDAPLSVKRAFRRGELLELGAEAGLPPASIRWHWAFRWQAVWRH